MPNHASPLHGAYEFLSKHLLYVLSRYNLERFSTRLQRVKKLSNLHEPIPEGYFPKLNSLVASRVWPARVSDAVLKVSERVDLTPNVMFET